MKGQALFHSWFFGVCLAAFLFCAKASALDFSYMVQDWDGVRFASYSFQGTQIWNDKQKENAIFGYNSISTNTPISDKDFIPIYPSTTAISQIETILGKPIHSGIWPGNNMKLDDVLFVLNNSTWPAITDYVAKLNAISPPLP